MAADADIAAVLNSGSANFTLGTNLFTGKVRAIDPAGGIPAKCVFCLLTGGPPPFAMHDENSKELYYPTVQVVVRSDLRAMAAGQALAREAYGLLHDAAVSGYISCRARESEPNYLNEDEKGSHFWSINFELIEERP